MDRLKETFPHCQSALTVSVQITQYQMVTEGSEGTLCHVDRRWDTLNCKELFLRLLLNGSATI